MGPLQGIRIIEMASLAPGPHAAMMLADLGADVLRVDRPEPMESNANITVNLLNRSRTSIALDVKTHDGLAALKRLIANADGLIESYRPGVMERLGLGPDECLTLNPALVYGRVTGWGQEGPLAQAAGHDLNYIALTGALHSLGDSDRPPTVPLNLLGDFAGGGMLLAFGIVCALLEAKGSGKGQVVDAAMADGVSSLMTYIHGFRASDMWNDERGTNVLDGSAPYYAVYRTSDDRYVSVAAAEGKFFHELLTRIGLDPAELPHQHDRAGWPELRRRLTEVFASRTQAEWTALLEGTDSCFAPVLSIPEAIEHPHNRARGAFIDIDGTAQPAPSPRFSRTPAQASAGQVLVDDPDGSLAAWGLTADDVTDLRERGAVGRR